MGAELTADVGQNLKSGETTHEIEISELQPSTNTYLFGSVYTLFLLSCFEKDKHSNEKLHVF